MKKSKLIVLGGLLAGALLLGGKPALALDSWDYGWRGGEVRRDYRDVERFKRKLYRDEMELRRDLRDGAGPGEIARDRRQIARDRQLLAEAYGDYGGHGYGARDSAWGSGYRW
jgi:hypothetical protein